MKVHGGRYKFRYKYKVMLSLAIFSFITISAIGTYLFFSYRDHQFSRLIDSSNTNVEQVRSQVDERLENIKRYDLASITDSEIQDIIEKDISYSDYTMIKDARETLAGNGIFIDYVSGYSFINYRTGWVICNKGMYQLSSIINAEEVQGIYDKIDTSQLKNFWYYETIPEDVIGVNDAGYRETILLSGLSFILKLPLSNPQIYGMLIANINMNELYGWMQDGLLDEENIVVLGADGEVIFSSEDKLNEICQNADNGGWKDIVTVDGNKYILARSISSVLGWTYYVVTDWNSISGETYKYSLSITIMLFAIILGVVTILIFYIIYTPIKTLAKKAADTSSGSGNPRDELEILEASLENLEGSNAQLEAKVKEQRSRVMELFFLRLLREDLSENEMDSYLERFGISRQLEYQTMMVFFKEKEDGPLLSIDDKDRIGYELVHNLPKQISQSISLQPLFYTHGILFVIQEGNKNVNLHLIMEIFDVLEKHVEEKYQMMIGAGVSLEHADFYELGKAYKESMAALSHIDGSSVLDEEELQEQEDSLPKMPYSYLRYFRRNKRQGKEIYDVTYENEMKAAILCCDREQILESVSHFFRYLKEQELTRENTIFYIMQFVDRTIKDFVEFGIDVSAVYREGISNIYTHVLQYYQLDELREYLISSLYIPSIDAQGAINDGQSHIILTNLLDYIEEKKGNVTLAECSTHLSYHPTYLWKILKNEKNMTFSEYLEQYKISLAKQLLIDTDMTVSEISKQFDYTNVQNFIRFFNKACGVTPGKFRSMNR